MASTAHKLESQEERERRLFVDLRFFGRKPRKIYPTSGDPNIIGEHEVPPVCCQRCGHKIPWRIIKGWRD
jgi:hypothetical protein